MPVTMVDATGTNAGNIPTSTPLVAGYVTGTGIVPWAAAQWQRFLNSGHVRINQGATTLDPCACDVLDVEQYALTPQQVPGLVQTRLANGIMWTTVYGTQATIGAIRTALEGGGTHGWYYGHVDCWLANWNLSLAQAEALLGTEEAGITIRAVQWASATSNPATTLPGSSMTLQQAQVDLSVAQDGWHAYFPPHPAAAPAASWLPAAVSQAESLSSGVASLAATLKSHQ